MGLALPADLQDDGLTPKQRVAADLIARGHSFPSIAQELNVTLRTIYNYYYNPLVKTAIMRTQRELLSQGQGRGIGAVPLAVETLVSILKNNEARDSDRIRAAQVLLSGVGADSENKALERKIRQIEAMAAEVLGSDADAYMKLDTLLSAAVEPTPEDAE